MTSNEKVSQLRGILQKEDSFANLSMATKTIGNIIDADIYLLESECKILSSSDNKGRSLVVEFEPVFKQLLESITQPIVNLPLETSLFKDEAKTDKDLVLTVYPLALAGKRIGTLLMIRTGSKFSEEEIPVMEMSALVVSVLLGGIGVDTREKDEMQKTTAKIAVGSLSYTEYEAIRIVILELGGEEGLLVASKLANRIGVTRSVIVNAMRKLGSAGVVESFSLGKKGTFIRIRNPYFLSELGSINHK